MTGVRPSIHNLLGRDFRKGVLGYLVVRGPGACEGANRLR